MLESGGVEDIVVPAEAFDLGADQCAEDVAATVQSEGGEFPGAVAGGGADVAHQLHHVVLADVHHV